MVSLRGSAGRLAMTNRPVNHAEESLPLMYLPSLYQAYLSCEAKQKQEEAAYRAAGRNENRQE